MKLFRWIRGGRIFHRQFFFLFSDDVARQTKNAVILKVWSLRNISYSKVGLHFGIQNRLRSVLYGVFAFSYCFLLFYPPPSVLPRLYINSVLFLVWRSISTPTSLDRSRCDPISLCPVYRFLPRASPFFKFQFSLSIFAVWWKKKGGREMKCVVSFESHGYVKATAITIPFFFCCYISRKKKWAPTHVDAVSISPDWRGIKR